MSIVELFHTWSFNLFSICPAYIVKKNIYIIIQCKNFWFK